MNTEEKKRLMEVYSRAEVVPFDPNSKFIMFSDCHRGQGNAGDNFLANQNLFFGALEYYLEQGYTYIELGDGDELWENRNMELIIHMHSDAFWIMKQFYEDNRFYMLYGNHDIVKGRKSYMGRHCDAYYCECAKEKIPLFPGMTAREGLILEERETGERLFLLHGHQGELLNDKLWPLARFLVRYVWSGLELIGFLDPTRAGRSHKMKGRIEKRLDEFGREENTLVVAGHTHRPYFSRPGQGNYFNDGSCVHPRCITGIEIEKNQISLIKWSVCTRKDRSLYVAREVLEGPRPLSAFCVSHK